MANRNLDEYQPKRFYSQNTKARENGFAKFEKDGAYYFALYQDGDIVMLSQAYKGISGRDNGIESVRKNRCITKRYRFDKRAGNKHGFGLYAGNGQEIAISPNLNSAAEAERVAGRLNGTVKAAAKPKAAPKKATSKKPAAKKSAPKKPRAANNEDNYKRLSFYEKHTKGRKNGIEKFKGDDGEYYFSYFENGKIRLISESYPTATARDTGAASVEKNIKLEKRYDYRGPLKNGKYDFRLKAGNGKEIARSIWYGSAAAAATGAAYLIGSRKRSAPKPKVAKVAPIAAAAVAAPAMAAAAKYRGPQDKDDDYLKCEEYHGHKVTDKANNIAFFSHKNKEYFVLYDADGDVRLRSEGFESISKRSSELNAVLRLKDTKSAYKRIEKAGHYMDILYDENGREVGRSCLKKIKPVVAAAAPVVAAAPVAAAAVPAAAATTGGGWGFLRWLIPLLLALLAAIFLFKFCKPAPKPVVIPAVSCWDGSEAENRAACPAKVTCWDGTNVKDAVSCPAEPVKVETFTCWDGSEVEALSSCPAEPVVEPEPIVEPTPEPVRTNVSRICGSSSNVLFDIPNHSPKTVSYLGSNPQYGNSHGLTTGQFYEKLLAAHRSGGSDQAFLNLMARSMGYSNFRDMSAADFSNDTLANGSKGLLGVSSSHMLQYSMIQTNDPSHLEAFRLRSLNGTDLHIMKSCGNYMYVCN